MIRFGTEEFFRNYIENQLRKENNNLNTIYRIHFAMTNFIFETFKGKEAITYLKNLNTVCEEYSNTMSKVSPYV